MSRSEKSQSGGAGMRARMLVIGVLALIGVLAVWHEPRPRNFGVIEPGLLYRSGRLSPGTLRRVVEDRHIRTIVDFGAYAPGSREELREQELAEQLGVRRVRLRLRGDGTGDPNEYVEALRVMTDSGAQPVLIHCAAGTNRTGVCTMLYRHIIQGDDFKGAYREAMKYGHDAGTDWVSLTYLADWSDEIRRSFETGETIPWAVVVRNK